MKLRPTSYLMLGMVSLGARSGYAIKKIAELSTHYFWPTSLAQVYPELAKLHEAELLRRSDDDQGNRARSAYDLTDEGEQALLRWLRSYRPEDRPPQVPDEGLLRLFFADALPVDEQLTLVRALRLRAVTAEAHMRDQVIPLALTLEQSGKRFPTRAARLASEAWASAAAWLGELEAELGREADGESEAASSGPDTPR